MSYRVEEKEAIRIVGIRIPLTFDMEENKKIVPPFWSKALKQPIPGNLQSVKPVTGGCARSYRMSKLGRNLLLHCGCNR